MKITTKELEQCEVLLTVEIEPKKEQKMLQKAAKKIARQVRIPGFRPGKAPYNVIVRRFGIEALQQEVLEESADKVIKDALGDAGVEPYAQIGVESIDWDPLVIKLKVPTQPVVELADYRNIRIDMAEIEVNEEDVQGTLEQMQEQTATWNPVEHPAEVGDLVSMDMVEKDGEEVLREQKSIEHTLSDPEEHKGHNHPDLNAPLLGLSEDEEKTFTLTYPEEFDNKTYAGKEITFEVKVLSVKEKEVDPLDDNFAKSIGDFETLDDLKLNIAENLLQQRQYEQTKKIGENALAQILEDSHIAWPEAFEKERVDSEISRQERQIEQHGLTLDNYLSMQNKTKEEFQKEIHEEMIKQLQRGFALNKLAELESLAVSESEILTQAKLMSEVSGRGDEVWRNILASEDQQRILANEILVNKSIHWLAALAKGEDPQHEVADAVESEPKADATPEANVANEGEETEADPVDETSDTDGIETVTEEIEEEKISEDTE